MPALVKRLRQLGSHGLACLVPAECLHKHVPRHKAPGLLSGPVLLLILGRGHLAQHQIRDRHDCGMANTAVRGVDPPRAVPWPPCRLLAITCHRCWSRQSCTSAPLSICMAASGWNPPPAGNPQFLCVRGSGSPRPGKSLPHLPWDHGRWCGLQCTALLSRLVTGCWHNWHNRGMSCSSSLSMLCQSR